MINKNIEIGFQSAVCHLCQRTLVPLLRNDRGSNENDLYLGLGKTGKTLPKTSTFSSITFNFEFYPTL